MSSASTHIERALNDSRPRPSTIEERLCRQRFGQLTVDLRYREVRVCGHLVELTPMEYSVLRALAVDPRRVFTRDELCRAVWGATQRGRAIDAHVIRLRRKISVHGQQFVESVHSVGWRLLEPQPLPHVTHVHVVRHGGRLFMFENPDQAAEYADRKGLQVEVGSVMDNVAGAMFLDPVEAVA